MSLVWVFDELGSERSRSSESTQNEAQGEFGVTCNDSTKDSKVKVVARRPRADRRAMLFLCSGSGALFHRMGA